MAKNVVIILMKKYFDLSRTCIKTLNHVFLIMANNQHIFNVLEE